MKNRELALLRELCETQRKLIAELEKRPFMQVSQPWPYISIPSVWQVRCNPGPCIYGDNSIVVTCDNAAGKEISGNVVATTTGNPMPRVCTKCGCVEPVQGYTITCSNAQQAEELAKSPGTTGTFFVSTNPGYDDAVREGKVTGFLQGRR
jgi:hypothetical protein